MATYSYTVTANAEGTDYLWNGHGLINAVSPTLYFRDGDAVTITNNSSTHPIQIVPDNGDVIDEVNGVLYFNPVVEGSYTYSKQNDSTWLTGRIYVGAAYTNQGPEDGYGTGPLPAHDTQVGVNQIRTKINEIITKGGVGSGSVSIGESAPEQSAPGSLWFKSDFNDLYIYSDSILADETWSTSLSVAEDFTADGLYDSYEYDLVSSAEHLLNLSFEISSQVSFLKHGASSRTNHNFDLSLLFNYNSESNSFDVSGSIAPQSQDGFTQLGGDALFDTATRLASSKNGETVALSNPSANNPSINGLVRIYRLIDNVWTQIGSDIWGTEDNQRNGYAISLNADGNVLAVTSRNSYLHDRGRQAQVKVYSFNQTDWIQLGNDIENVSGSGWYFAESLSLSADGNRLALGHRGFNGNDGRTMIYDFDGSNWLQLGSDILGNSSSDENLGASVALSADGNYLCIGSTNYESLGRTQVYHWNQTNWTKLGGDLTSASLSDYPGYNPPNDNYYDLNNGDKVDISYDPDSGHNTITVATSNRPVFLDGVFYNEQPITKIYTWNGSSWVQRGTTIRSPMRSIDDYSFFVTGLSLDGETFMITDTNGLNASGQAVQLSANIYQYISSNNSWMQKSKIKTRQGRSCLSKDGNTVFVSRDTTSVNAYRSTASGQLSFPILGSLSNTQDSLLNISRSYLDPSVFETKLDLENEFSVLLKKDGDYIVLKFQASNSSDASSTEDVDVEYITANGTYNTLGSGWIQI